MEGAVYKLPYTGPTLNTTNTWVSYTKNLRSICRVTKSNVLDRPFVTVEQVLALAGAWGERNWKDVEEELDRIRHESKPTPPFAP